MDKTACPLRDPINLVSFDRTWLIRDNTLVACRRAINAPQGIAVPIIYGQHGLTVTVRHHRPRGRFWRLPEFECCSLHDENPLVPVTGGHGRILRAANGKRHKQSVM